MTEGTESKPQVLKGEAALELWRKGPDEWNNWIRLNPGRNISFFGIDFSSERGPEQTLSFSSYYFGDGDVDFSDATFGDGDVDFSDATFGDGDVSFFRATFGEGDVSFSDATFGNGDVTFSFATFGNGDVDFSDATFGNGDVTFSFATFGNGDVDFSDATFGDGEVSFSGAKFCEGDVDFSDATFGDGEVSFFRATFGDGEVSFFRATFGDGEVSFLNATFGDGKVSFFGATFGNGDVSFFRATFGKGDVSFSDATFGNGDVIFLNAKFGEGDVSFLNAKFGDGDVVFLNAKFGDGDVSFLNATFGDGKIYFSDATFGDGYVSFSGVTFGDGNIMFDQAKFATIRFNPARIEAQRILARDLSIKKQAFFEFPPAAEALSFLSFQGASFDGPLRLSGNIGIIPDLRATRYSHQVDLSALNVKLRRVWQWRSWPPKLSPVAEDPTDGAKSRRLKEIAETNKDHHAALRFSADENRARRWRETSWLGSVLDMAFSACSDYGQNILRPTGALLVFTVAFTLLYKAMTTAVPTDIGRIWHQAALLSVSNSMPFLPQSRILRTDAIDVLYCGTSSPAVDAIMITQGVFSFAFLFLIGLGLRNRFRL